VGWMNMGILTTPAGGPASLSVHGGICVYRVTLRRLHWVGEIDASILMTLVGGHREGHHPGLSLLIL